MDKKTVLITGASSGFGLACAKRFAKENWKLILAARRTERLIELANELNLGEDLHWHALDVQERDKISSFIETLPENFSNIDLLVNNAGLAAGLSPAHEADIVDWDLMVDTNIKGLMYLTRAVLPKMVKRKTGQIINVGSVAGNWPYPGGNVYGGTKAFVQQFSRNLRCDLSGTNIRVSNIEPGLAESEFSLVRYKGDSAKAANVYQGTKPLTPEDIAEIIYWTASLPEHVNINTLEVMPTCQAWSPFSVYREG